MPDDSILRDLFARWELVWHEDRRDARPDRHAGLPDRGWQAGGNLAVGPTTEIGMDRRRCAGALAEPAAKQVGPVKSLAAITAVCLSRSSYAQGTGRRSSRPT